MGAVNISDIVLTPLSSIEVDGGNVLHAMKFNDIGFAGFGEAYFSWVKVGAIKGWKRHLKMTMNLIVPVGTVQFVFVGEDSSGNREFRVEEIGDECYSRITVPPGFWFGFQGMRTTKSLVLNIANIAHDPNEEERLTLADIDYVWS